MFNTGIVKKLGLASFVNYLFDPKVRKRRINKRLIRKVASRGTKKVFVIGLNKTGTTSIEIALKELGFIMGDQGKATVQMRKVKNNDFSWIEELTRSAEAFQDIPYSLPSVYKELYIRYPNAKYILSVRDSAEQWFNSIYSFHKKVLFEETEPDKEKIKNHQHIYPGFLQEFIDYCFDGVVYDKEYYETKYTKHTENVIQFFKENDGELLTINVSRPEDYKRLCEFLGKTPKRNGFPWVNKTNKKQITK